MSTKILLRITSIYMFIRIAAQIFFSYKIPENHNNVQNYLLQPSDLVHNHEFFYWGFCIAFALAGRLLWVASDSKELMSGAIIEGSFWFLFSFGIVEIVYDFYFTGTATIICSILLGICYFKNKGLSIKISYNKPNADSKELSK